MVLDGSGLIAICSGFLSVTELCGASPALCECESRNSWSQKHAGLGFLTKKVSDPGAVNKALALSCAEAMQKA